MTIMTNHNPEPAAEKSLRRTRGATLEEVVGRLAEIHTGIASQYERMLEHAPDQRVQLVLQYLAGQESALAVYLHRFVKQAPETVVRRRFKYVPALEAEELLQNLESEQPENIDALSALLQRIHRAIDAVYEPLTGSSEVLPEDLAESVEKLRLQEREHVKEQLRAATDE